MTILSSNLEPPNVSGVLGCIGALSLLEYSWEGNSPSGTAWPAANLAIFVPVIFHRPTTVKQFMWYNGGTVSGNVDAGIYDVSGTRLLSWGGGPQSGTNTIQLGDVTDTTFQPGYYFMGLVLDNSTGLIVRSQPHQQWMQAMGCQQASTAYVLPSTVTFANPGQAYLPMFGLALQATA